MRRHLAAIATELGGLCAAHSGYPAADGSMRLLVELADGQTVECVLLPGDGLCVSTQVGCAVGCLFCMTGAGRPRAAARQCRDRRAGRARAGRSVAVSKVVFMGMGEPAHNLDNVLEAIELLGTQGDIGHKNLVFSTVGDRRVFERLPRRSVKPALALSLHSTIADRRAKLLPRAPRMILWSWSTGRGLRAHDGLPDPVPVDVARGRERQRRRGGRHRPTAQGQVRGDEPDSPATPFPGCRSHDPRSSDCWGCRASSTRAACSPSCATPPGRTSKAGAVSCARARSRSRRCTHEPEGPSRGRIRPEARQRGGSPVSGKSPDHARLDRVVAEARRAARSGSGATASGR